MPTAIPLPLPPPYGKPTRPLDWSLVGGLLADATIYWVATTRSDGRPHIVPKDGIWLDDRLHFGGAPETVNHRNLVANPAASVHIGDGPTTVIVEGAAAIVVPTRAEAEQLAADSRRKYSYGATAYTYAEGVWALTPTRVIAWTAYPTDATRFTF